MFRRRRRQDEDEAGLPAEEEAVAEDTAAEGGPWDAADDGIPGVERIDFGSLKVPVRDGFEIQISMTEDQAAWITVVRGESGLQLQAFAAPKSGGLWDDVREEIAAEIAKSGGESEEAPGPFGTELRAQIAAEPPARGAHQPARFLGVDGPRWFLRGVITGPAARRHELAKPLEELFAEVVVVRGAHPVPPRDMLEIRLPEEARQAMAGQAEGPEEGRWPLGPFERGPEITETR